MRKPTPEPVVDHAEAAQALWKHSGHGPGAYAWGVMQDLARKRRWPTTPVAGNALASVARVLDGEPKAVAKSHWPEPKGYKQAHGQRYRDVYRIAIPAVSENGEHVSTHYRATGVLPTGEPKTRWPVGSGRRGLFACPRALDVLQGNLNTVRRVLLVEGVTDYLRAVIATREDTDLDDVGVVGLTSGADKTLALVKWPDELEIYAAPDSDPPNKDGRLSAGENYARKWSEAVHSHKLYRLDITRPKLGERRSYDLDDDLSKHGKDLGAMMNKARNSVDSVVELEADSGDAGEGSPASRAIARVNEQWGAVPPDWWDATPPDRVWLLEYTGPCRDKQHPPRLFPCGAVSLLIGPGGVGKSFALIQLAIAVATGTGMFREPTGEGTHSTTVKPGRVLLALGEEDHAEIWRRVRYVADELRLTKQQRQHLSERLYPLALAGVDTRVIDEDGKTDTPLAVHLRRLLVDNGPWKAVIMDPLSRWAGADTEKDNAAATRFMEVAERFTEVNGEDVPPPAVILSHHTSQANRNSTDALAARGATALIDGARFACNLSPLLGGGRFVHFAPSKSNYGEQHKPIVLERRRGLLVGGEAVRRQYDAEVERVATETAKAKAAAKSPTRKMAKIGKAVDPSLSAMMGDE